MFYSNPKTMLNKAYKRSNSSPKLITKSTFLRLQESLDCPVCFEQYDDNARVPKMMSCLHTVCVSCILDLLGLEGQHRGASEPEIPRGRKVTCPLCREEILTEKMQTNR